MRSNRRDARLDRRDEILTSTSLVSELIINEAVDRETNEMALKSIEPLSELEEMLESINKMPDTKAAIGKCIDDIRDAINSKPSKILSALRLSNSQKGLVDAITAGEVLKFSMLNAMDALRMSFISDFKKELADEVISFNVVGQAPSLVLSNPGRAPFSKVSELGEYHTITHGTHFMIVGPKLTNPGGSIVMRVPTTSFGLQLKNVSPGPIYITGRDSEGNPAAVPDGVKKMFLGNIAIPNRAIIDKKIVDLLTVKRKLNPAKAPDAVKNIVKPNFRVPAPVEGMLTGIYRAIRRSKAVKPPGLDADTFASEVKELTLGEFKRVFNAIVSKTEGAKGDFTTYDLADSLFLGGLAAVSGALGITRTPKVPTSPAAAGSTSVPTGGGAPPPGSPQGRGSSGAPPAPPANAPHHSLRNVLSNPMIAAGSTPAERSANMSKISNALNQDELRRTLNSLTGGAIVFTEGTVDRWCELAGIKEGR